METHSPKPLLRFLEQDLAIPSSALEMAERLAIASLGSLPMILWQYGLIDLNQLEQVFDAQW
ncbi:MAG: DUF2949 domain-containing protein [Microcystaceae cyanobacterium]